MCQTKSNDLIFEIGILAYIASRYIGILIWEKNIYTPSSSPSRLNLRKDSLYSNRHTIFDITYIYFPVDKNARSSGSGAWLPTVFQECKAARAQARADRCNIVSLTSTTTPLSGNIIYIICIYIRLRVLCKRSGPTHPVTRYYTFSRATEIQKHNNIW